MTNHSIAVLRLQWRPVEDTQHAPSPAWQLWSPAFTVDELVDAAWTCGPRRSMRVGDTEYELMVRSLKHGTTMSVRVLGQLYQARTIEERTELLIRWLESLDAALVDRRARCKRCHGLVDDQGVRVEISPPQFHTPYRPR